MASKALVVGASNFSSRYIEKLLPDYNFIIACDKGAEAFIEKGLNYDMAIGDFDSIGEIYKEKMDLNKILKYPITKDYTDLELAIDYLSSKAFDRIDFTGVLGGRLSHELVNLALFYKLKKSGKKVAVREYYTRLEFIGDGETLRVPKGVYVSIVPFTDNSFVTLKGFRWDLTNRRLQLASSLTVSNYAIETGYINCHGEPFLVIIEPKED